MMMEQDFHYLELPFFCYEMNLKIQAQKEEN